MLVIGLTGLIGSGKSTVAAIFAKLGVVILDTDLISHQLTSAGGAAVPDLIKQFGPQIKSSNGGVDRRQLRELVFKHPLQLAQLEAILHPMILAHVKLSLAQAQDSPYVIIVVPLLFKSQSYLQLTQRNIFVDCRYQLLVERLAERSQLSRMDVDAILAQQVSREQQLALADDIIVNENSLDQLEYQVLSLHQHYLWIRQQSNV